MAFVAASVAVAPAVVAFTVALGLDLAVTLTWFSWTTLLLAKNIREGIGGQCLLHEVAFAVHAFDAGSYRIQSFAEQGESHGGLVAVEHREGVEHI